MKKQISFEDARQQFDSAISRFALLPGPGTAIDAFKASVSYRASLRRIADYDGGISLETSQVFREEIGEGGDLMARVYLAHPTLFQHTNVPCLIPVMRYILPSFIDTTKVY
ncbi:MAG: hypothetical protein RL557_992 [archaeon]|jgi:hypothetical protein